MMLCTAWQVSVTWGPILSTVRICLLIVIVGHSKWIKGINQTQKNGSLTCSSIIAQSCTLQVARLLRPRLPCYILRAASTPEPAS